MQRREFLTFLSCSIVSASFFQVFSGSNYVEVQAKDPLVLRTYDSGSEICTNRDIMLPSDANLYTTIFHLDVGPGRMPRIHGDTNNLQITKPGKYTIQYLGEFYGWSIV